MAAESRKHCLSMPAEIVPRFAPDQILLLGPSPQDAGGLSPIPAANGLPAPCARRYARSGLAKGLRTFPAAAPTPGSSRAGSRNFALPPPSHFAPPTKHGGGPTDSGQGLVNALCAYKTF